MTFQRENIPEIPPIGQESWADYGADITMDRIPRLGLELGDVTKLVSQRQILDFHPAEGPQNIVSDGFSRCSGMLLRNQETGGYTFSHLEPFADVWHDHMKTGSSRPVRWQAPHDAVFIYGGQSSRQYEVERLLDGNFWGPTASLRQINLETGNTHWGLGFYSRLGQLAVMRKTPDQSIFRYQLFDPIAE